MTEEIAYKLGEFNFPSFYQNAIWKPNKETFPLASFFNWGLSGGWPCKRKTDGSGEYEEDWTNISLSGGLKLSEIKTIGQKLAYIKGRLKSYSVTIEPTKIRVLYANSHNFRDFFAQCAHDVISDKFVYEEESTESGGLKLRRFKRNSPNFKIITAEGIMSIPATPYCEILADTEIITYLAEPFVPKDKIFQFKDVDEFEIVNLWDLDKQVSGDKIIYKK